MLGDVHLVTEPSAQTAPTETHLLRELVRRQLTVLFSRHSPEDVILVRVLIEYCQHAAMIAKAGEVERARAELTALSRQIPAEEELGRAVDVAALPALALVNWREGDHDAARGQLVDALDACAELASRWGHDYLTGKQLHLAINIVRVSITQRDWGGAGTLLAALRAVAAGDRDRWPFAGRESLEVPLSGMESLVIDAQLARTADRLAARSG